jgi:hypothetical protein
MAKGYDMPMPTMFDIRKPSYPSHQTLWEPAPTMAGTATYEGFWATSGAGWEVVDGDRIAANPINAVDPLGLWVVRREGQPRAEAIPTDKHDTIRTLAKEIGLNVDQFPSWLKVYDLFGRERPESMKGGWA